MPVAILTADIVIPPQIPMSPDQSQAILKPCLHSSINPVRLPNLIYTTNFCAPPCSGSDNQQMLPTMDP